MDVLFFCIQVNTLLFAIAQTPTQTIELWKKQKDPKSVLVQEIRRTKRYESRKLKECGLLVPTRIHNIVSKSLRNLDIFTYTYTQALNK